MLAAVIAVPIMLVPKPLILKKRAAKRAAQLESYGQVCTLTWQLALGLGGLLRVQRLTV